MAQFPKRVICMTEESVELMYLLGLEEHLLGVSTYAQRPRQVKEKPVISAFTHANLKKVIGLKPDLILGFSDIQKDIARDLIGRGLNVFITNQRSLEEILSTLLQLSALLGEAERGATLVAGYESQIKQARAWSQSLSGKPRVYIEEWDEPMITGIQWFSELVELCGGDPLFKQRSRGSLAQERFVTHQEVITENPDIILACWCGKKVDIASIYSRAGYHSVSAIKNEKVIELRPEIYLQPGPALFEEGLKELREILHG
jgi:iron complex transport system substrate-binding protein